MSDETQAQVPPNLSREERLEQVLAEYLRQVEQGAPVDQQALLAAHPDLADDLREFFGNQMRIQRLMGAGSPPHGRNGTPTKLRYFGDYEILEVIAQGGMGVVYKARQTTLNRVVAVKMILAGQLANESDVKRFQAEAEAAANLHHPGVVGIYEVGVQDGQHYYSMEYIDGQNLAQAVREKPLSVTQAAEYVREMATVLEYAHQRKVLHRDLKPSNVLIDAAGRLRITDFGLAKRVEGESDLTMTGQVLGTPSYMSPEQAAAQHAIIGPSTDIYALGVILYELVTGRPPFRSEIVTETLRQVQHDEPLRPRLLNPKLPRDLETICLKCLEKEPRKRYATAESLADDLGRYLRGEPILARPISRPARIWRWCRRKPVVASLTAVTSLAVSLAIVVLIASNIRVNDALTSRTTALEKLGIEQGRTQEALSAKTTALTDLDKTNQKLRNSLTKEKQSQSELTTTNASLRESIVREQGATYARGVNLVFQHLAANDLPQANAILDECRPDALRGWEWRYLHRQCNPAGLFFLRGYVGHGAVAPFSPDGRRLAVFPDDGTIRIIDLASGNDLAILRGHNAGVTALAFSPDGTRIAAAGSHWDRSQGVVYGQISVWDAADGCQLFATMKAASALAFSPDSKHLAVGVTADPNESHIEILDTESGRPLNSFPPQTGKHGDIAFTPDGKLVVVAGAGGAYNVETGEQAFPASPPPTAGTECLAFSADGKWLALGNGAGVITIWDMQQKVIARTIQAHAEFVHSLSFHRDSQMLASASNDQSVKVWDAPSGRELYSIRHKSLGFCAAAFSPDGEYLLTGTWGSGQFNHFGFAVMTRGAITPGEVRIWHASSGASARLLSAHKRAGWGIQHSSDGKLVATAGEDKSVILWDSGTGKPLNTLSGHEDFVCGLAFGPHDKMLASASRDKTVRLWDPATGRQLQVLRHKAEAHAVAFSQDGKWLASTASDGTVTIWNVATGEEVHSWKAHSGRATSVVFRADSRQIVTAGSDKAVRFWDTSDWHQVGKDLIHSGIVFQIALTPDGSRLGVVGSNGQMPCGFGFTNTAAGILQLHRERRDGFVRVWDLKTNQDAFRIPDQPHPVYGVAFTPDSSRMVVTIDKGLRFWDLALGQELLTLPLGRGITHGVSISPSGQVIAVSDGSGNVSLLDANPRPQEQWRDLAFRREDEGRLLLSAGDRPGALLSLQEALRLRKQVAAAEPQNLRFQAEIADVHEDLEQFYNQAGPPASVAEARKLATELRQKLAAESPKSSTLTDDLAWSFLKQSLRTPSAPGQNAGEEIGRRGVGLLEQLQKDAPDSPPAALNVANGHVEFARLLRRTRLAAAPAAYQQAIDVLTPLLEKNPQLATLRMQLISIRAELADVQQQIGKRDEALAEQRRAALQTEQLTQLFPWVRAYRHELARQTGRLGKYLTGSANAEEANAAFARTQAILEQLVLEGPSDTFCRRDLAQHYMEQAKRHKSQSQNDQAEAAFQKALPIYEALAGSRATAAEIRVYGMALNELGIFYFHLDRYDETQPLYEKALTLREKLAAQNKNDAVYAVDLGGSYCNLGHLYQIGRKDTEEALKWYEKSVQTLQPLAAKNPTAKRYLFNAYQGRAESLFKLSRYAEAARDFDLAVGLGIEPGAVEFRWRRALAWASAGEHAKAAKEAEELAAGKTSPKMLVDLAEIWSRAAEAAKSDSTLSEKYAAQGLATVKQAVSQGFKDRERLKSSVHLEFVRMRPEFSKILEEIDSPP